MPCTDDEEKCETVSKEVCKDVTEPLCEIKKREECKKVETEVCVKVPKEVIQLPPIRRKMTLWAGHLFILLRPVRAFLMYCSF